jgi:hypothetical protein
MTSAPTQGSERVFVDVSPEGGISVQPVQGTKATLRGLGLSEDLTG